MIVFQYHLTMSDPLSSFLFFCDAQVPEWYQVTAIGSTRAWCYHHLPRWSKDGESSTTCFKATNPGVLLCSRDDMPRKPRHPMKNGYLMAGKVGK